MSSDFILLIFNYSIIPFISAIILTYIALRGYQKLKYRSFWIHRVDLLAINLEKRAREQISQIEQISTQLAGIYERISKAEEKIKEIQEMKNMLDEHLELTNDQKNQVTSVCNITDRKLRK